MKLIQKKTDQKKEWDEIWEDKKFINKFVDFGRYFYNLRFILLLKEYTRNKDFCELGCGTSSFMVQIKNAKSLTGIDYSNKALSWSKNLFKKKKVKGTFLNDNVLGLKTKKRFGVVWSQGLIEHFDDPAKVVEQHLKVTKKGGYTIISVPYKYSYIYLWFLISRPKFLSWIWPWTNQIFFTKKTLIKALKKYCKKEKNYKVKILPIFGLAILFVRKK